MGASGASSSISGGQLNEASVDSSSVSGGYINKALGEHSWGGGGVLNMASSATSSVSGGSSNKASGPNSSVSGGYMNDASGRSSSVSGGSSNIVDNQYATGLPFSRNDDGKWWQAETGSHFLFPGGLVLGERNLNCEYGNATLSVDAGKDGAGTNCPEGEGSV